MRKKTSETDIKTSSQGRRSRDKKVVVIIIRDHWIETKKEQSYVTVQHRVQFLSQITDNILALSERAMEFREAEHEKSHFTTFFFTFPTAITLSLPQITPQNNIIYFQSCHEFSQQLPWDRKRKSSKKWCLHSEWANQWCVCSIWKKKNPHTMCTRRDQDDSFNLYMNTIALFTWNPGDIRT